MKKLILVSALMLSSSAVLAGGVDKAPASKTFMNNFYITAGVGYGKNNNEGDLKAAGLGNTSTKDSGVAALAGVGYQFNPNIAVEAGYMYLPTSKGTDTYLGESFTTKLNSQMIYAVAKGIYPINEQFDVFAKAGAGFIYQDISVSADGVSLTLPGANQWSVAPLLGAGADYNINKHVAITAQAYYSIGTSKVNSMYGGLAGLTYKF